MINRTFFNHRFTTLVRWIKHLRQEHGHTIKIAVINFASTDDFFAWKEEEELKSDSQYIQKCSSRGTGLFKTWYFYCNRAGAYLPRGKNVRQLKSQGTNKLGMHCTAHIKAKQRRDTGHIKVTYCDAHTHPVRLAHIQIPKQVRQDVAAKLQMGVSMDRILHDIRESVVNKLDRKHLIAQYKSSIWY